MRKSSLSATIWLIATLFTGFSPPARAQEQTTLAVLEFDGLGISSQEVAALTNRLRTELVLSNAVTVVERGQMEQILTEQDFQMTGCTSNDCAVEVGQLLGVNTMVAGSIGKVGSTFSLDFRIIDVASGRIAFAIESRIDSRVRALETFTQGIQGESKSILLGFVDELKKKYIEKI